MKKIRFSIIVPVYNVEKYLKDCLESIINQTYKNYEVIVINDGSTDDSIKIIEKYMHNDNIKIINQNNQGLSIARNNGVLESNGDYILFLDSDDYLELNALEILEKSISNQDVIRFQLIEVNENKNVINKQKEVPFKDLSGNSAFERIVKYKYVENAWLYCYKTEFFLKNKFKFEENCYHEDFGLTPIILSKAQKVLSINECIYNYRQRANSIMSTNDFYKIQKKCDDMYKLGIKNIEIISKTKLNNKEVFLSYIANSLVIKGRELPRLYRRSYYNRLRENNVFELMLKDTIQRKLKYILAKYAYNTYLKVIK